GGIAPEVLQTLFDQFTRGTPARTYGGLGLGLYLAQQIVFRLGGRITAASGLGEGATFTIELPPKGPPGTGRNAAAASPSTTTPTCARSSPRSSPPRDTTSRLRRVGAKR